MRKSEGEEEQPERHASSGPPPPPLPPPPMNGGSLLFQATTTATTSAAPDSAAGTGEPATLRQAQQQQQPLATISIQDLTSVQLRRTNLKMHATKTFSAPPNRSVSMTNGQSFYQLSPVFNNYIYILSFCNVILFFRSVRVILCAKD